MLQISITSNLDALQKSLNDTAQKQMPFALATALTSLAQLVVKAEQGNEHKVLDRPRPFTTNSIKVVKARKDRLASLVYMQDIAAKYLEPYEFGGSNVLNSKALLKPIAAVKDLDQYGNLPRGYFSKMKDRKDVFIGTVKTRRGPVSGLWQRSTEKGDRIGIKRRRDGTEYLGSTGKGLNKSGKLILLVKFSDAHPVVQHLRWFDVAGAVVSANVNKEFGKALGRALASAKK